MYLTDDGQKLNEYQLKTFKIMKDYENYKRNKNVNNDVFNSLSEENKKIAEKYVRFCIRGKLSRTVPVLLTNALFQCVTSIIIRKEAKELIRLWITSF